MERPNIILIMTDNQPADLLGCYGNDEIHTPNLDHMASESIHFDNAFCPNAMCSPSRASVWTGRMPCQHGVHTWLDDRLMNIWPKNWNAIREFDSLPEILKRNGYKTAMIGKYHLGHLDKPQNGVDHWVTMARGHTLDFHGNTMNVNGNHFTHKGHSVDFFTEKATEYILEHDSTTKDSFLLMLPYNGPYGHWPSIKGKSKNRFSQLYEHTDMHSVPREGLSQQAIDCFQLNTKFQFQGKGGTNFSSLLQIPNNIDSLRNYYSQMSIIDDGVGQIFSALKSANIEDNTLVIFTADHGFSLGHHGFWGHAQATWPSNAHRIAYNIPLLMWFPNQINSARTNSFVSSTDLYNTILGFLNLETSDDQSKLPSRDFSGLLSGNSDGWLDEVFIEQEETRAIRTPEWSFFERFKGSKNFPLYDELYDLKIDPDERTNLIDNPNFSKFTKELSKKIKDFFDTYADPKFDLWNGGTVKSNTSRPWLWKDAWGEKWEPLNS